MTTLSFIAQIAPVAISLRFEGSHIFPSVRIAQSGLETGWKVPSWNNLGGYKVGSGKPNDFWKGAVVNKGTWEVYDGKRVDITAAFRAYDTIEDFYRDQDLLFAKSRYDRVRAAQTPEEQAEMLYACGYATDPQYASKIKNIISTYGLKKYDDEVIKVYQQLVATINELRDEVKTMRRKVEKMESNHAMDVPDWAKEAVDAAVKAGIIDTPQGGSLDFYRLVTVMYRVGVFTDYVKGFR